MTDYLCLLFLGMALTSASKCHSIPYRNGKQYGRKQEKLQI
jgi:hypothetical protein